MKVKILGKYGPFAVKGCTSSYLLTNLDSCVLLDCGSGSVKKLIQSGDIYKLKFIVLSHLHFDHIADIGVLSYALASLRKEDKIKVYMPKCNLKAYETIKQITNFEIIEISEGVTYLDSGFTFSFYKMTHPVVSYGIKITNGDKTFSYTGDTTKNENIIPLCNGANLLLSDGAFLEKDYLPNKPHMSIKQVCDIANSLQVKTILSHISPFYTDEEVELEVNKFSNLVVVAKEDEEYQII